MQFQLERSSILEKGLGTSWTENLSWREGKEDPDASEKREVQ